MKHISLILAFLFTCAFAMPAFAYVPQDQPSTSDQLMTTIAAMDSHQKDVLLERANDIKNGDDSATKAKEWVDIGNSLGQALAGTARELGVAVNDFAKSPVGHLAIALIIWKVLGGTIIHFAGGLFSLIVLMFWWRLYRRMFGVFNEKGKLVKLTFRESSNEASGFITVAGAFIALGGLLCIVTA